MVKIQGRLDPFFLYFLINLKNIKLICEYLTSCIFFTTYIHMDFFLIFQCRVTISTHVHIYIYIYIYTYTYVCIKPLFT
jgi:hypothetical protein